MVITSHTLTDLLDLIEFTEIASSTPIIQELIFPDISDCFSQYHPPKEGESHLFTPSIYLTVGGRVYSWFKPHLMPHTPLPRTFESAVSLALENALVHGNHNTP